MHAALTLLEEQANAGIWHLTRESLKLWWSDGTYRIHGVSKADFTPTLDTALAFYTPDSRAVLIETLERSLETGEDYSVKLKMWRGDGALIDVLMIGRPVKENGVVQIITGAIFDLNMSYADIDLSQSTEGHFESLIASTPYGLVLTSADEQILLANSSFCEMLGYTELELLGTNLLDIIAEPDRERSVEHLKRLWSGNMNKARFERRYVHKDGRLIWVQVAFSLLRDETGRPLHAIRQFEDITLRKQQEEALFEAKELAQVTLASIADGVIRTDQSGVVTFCNDGAAKLLGKRTHEIVGQDIEACVELRDNDNERLAIHPVSYTLQTGLASRVPMTTRIRTSSGTLRPINNSVSPLRNRDGNPIGAVFVFQDATESLSMTERLAFDATHDFLTGLPNRSAAEQSLAKLLADPEIGDKTHHLFFLDLDHFKVVNDTSGHIAGDLMVKQISRVIGGMLRSEDMFARFGGDEFLLILPNSTVVGAETVAQKILNAVASYRFTFGERTYQVGVSIGITQIAGTTADLSQLLAQADAACYSAKTQGRGKFRFYSQRDREISTAYDDLSWSHRIRSAIQENYLQLFYQRIVDKDRRLIGVECLLRMTDENGQYVPPNLFLPAAERMGLMSQIDQWVCTRGVQLLAAAQVDPLAAKRIGSYLSINLSARTLSVSEFARWLPDFLDQHADVCGKLRIEITETEKSSWTTDEVNLIAAIRRRGVRVLLDDFGMGYNSFDVLKTVRFDGIKLDRQVVKDIETDPVDQALAEASVAIARNLGIQLVAEGVETEAAMAALQRMGVTCFQGHLFHCAELLPVATITPEGLVGYGDAELNTLFELTLRGSHAHTLVH